MNGKSFVARFYILILSFSLISCAGQPAQNVEAQKNFNSGRANSEPNSESNSKLESKDTSTDTDKNKSQSDTPIIKPSNIIEELRKKKNANPKISAKELAAYGNEILKSKGYDFTFDWEPKGKKNKENLSKLDSENYLPFEYQFTKADGKTQKFELLNNGFEHPCFSPIDVPVTQINEQTMAVISEGKEIELKKSKDFNTEEFVLVDKSKKPIRKWQTPIDATPSGISEDGKKVYFESYQFDENSTNDYKDSPINLAVEISEGGSLRFVDLKEIKSGKGVVIDYNKKYTEIQYEKYKVGKSEYIIKWSAPCT